MNFSSALKPIASLRLTVIGLGIGMVLIFAATLDQVELGIHAVEKKYIQSFFVIWEIPGAKIAGAQFGYLPLPGGFLLGGVLLVNLLAAHISRFKVSWKKSGIQMIHLGVILLIIGEICRGVFADETRMQIDEGSSSNYSEALREVELAIVDTSSDPENDQVVTIPQRMLREGAIQHPALPFVVKIHKYYPNSEILNRQDVPDAPPTLATTGFGVQSHVEPRPRATEIDEIDIVSVFAELRSPQGSLGIWLLTNAITEQSFVHEGKTYEISVRGRRDYKAFSIELKDFSHDKYAGTDIPKNYSSRVLLKHPEEGEDREILIYMNNPLRHGGYTFYQASFANADTTTILQVVKNPTWLMPYFACALVAIGLTVQFSFHLLRFISSRRRS